MNPESEKTIAETPREALVHMVPPEDLEAQARALLQAGKFDELHWVCLKAELPEAFLLELCENPELRCALAHRMGPLSLLHRLADQGEYSEPVQTLGQIYYREAVESTAQLAAFLQRHRWCRDVFATLIYDADLDDPRLAVVLSQMRGAEFEADLLELLAKLRRIEQAAVETDPTQIMQLAGLREPDVLRAIAQNPHTPESLLLELSQLRQIPHCRLIRVAAEAQLDARSRMKS